MAPRSDQHGHGEWGGMFDERLVPMSLNTAEQLMTIARHPILSNSAHARNLAPSWMTLYELAKVDRLGLKTVLKDGTVRPDMIIGSPAARWRHRARGDSNVLEQVPDRLAQDQPIELLRTQHTVDDRAATLDPVLLFGHRLQLVDGQAGGRSVLRRPGLGWPWRGPPGGGDPGSPGRLRRLRRADRWAGRVDDRARGRGPVTLL